MSLIKMHNVPDGDLDANLLPCELRRPGLLDGRPNDDPSRPSCDAGVPSSGRDMMRSNMGYGRNGALSLPSKLANEHCFAAQDTAYATASLPPTRRLEFSMRRALIIHHVMHSPEPESGPGPGQASQGLVRACHRSRAFTHCSAARVVRGVRHFRWTDPVENQDGGLKGARMCWVPKKQPKPSPGRPAKVLCCCYCCCCCCQQTGIFQVHRLFRLNDNLVDQHGHRSSRRTASAYADALDVEGINGTRA